MNDNLCQQCGNILYISLHEKTSVCNVCGLENTLIKVEVKKPENDSKQKPVSKSKIKIKMRKNGTFERWLLTRLDKTLISLSVIFGLLYWLMEFDSERVDYILLYYLPLPYLVIIAYIFLKKLPACRRKLKWKKGTFTILVSMIFAVLLSYPIILLVNAFLPAREVYILDGRIIQRSISKDNKSRSYYELAVIDNNTKELLEFDVSKSIYNKTHVNMKYRAKWTIGFLGIKYKWVFKPTHFG